jgi:hypothetical protein
MADNATLLARLEKLREMRASGVFESEIASGDGATRQRVKFRTDAELAAAIADLERQLSGPSVRVTYIRDAKGV